MKTSLRKNRKPFKRKFWQYIRFLPSTLRAKIIRSKFQIEYDLPSDIVFKLAETRDEVEQSLKLVHDSYVELGYIQKSVDSLYLNKFQRHPNSTILIIKQGPEVIGTMTILPDGPFDLPAEATWNLEEKRKGRLIAEVSALAIKKNVSLKQGRLLLPFCKYMYHFCQNYLGLDGLVAVTSEHVAPFYTDILLFDPVGDSKPKRHSFASKNRSLCFFIEMGEKTENLGRKIYQHKPLSRNFYQYFFEYETSNFHFPEKALTIQTYLDKKNRAISEILASDSISDIRFPRLLVREKVWCFHQKSRELLEATVVDLSEQGIQLIFKSTFVSVKPEDTLGLIVEKEGSLSLHEFKVIWLNDSLRCGCELKSRKLRWHQSIKEYMNEFNDLRSSAV